MPVDAVTAFLHRRPLKRLRRRLAPGETIEAVSAGTHDGRSGDVVITSHAMYWVPKRGRIQVRRKRPVHDQRRGASSGLMDSHHPTWQVQDAPAGEARAVANATRNPSGPESRTREQRVRHLLETGRITQDEAEWMLRTTN